MLAHANSMHHHAGMGKAKKRTRATPTKSAPSTITIRELLRDKDGIQWVTHLVQGWKENGKWQRKQFKERKDAERFAAMKRIELENTGRKQQMILTPLTEKQSREAADAFDALGETYTLTEAVDFFLKNHRPPEYVTTIKEGMGLYLDDKEREGARTRTIKGTRGVLNGLAHSTENPEVHKVTTQMIEKHLRGLRAQDGVSPAKRKSWNTHRNEISQFFEWAMKPDLATNRPWCFANPVEPVRSYSNAQIAEERPPKATTDPNDLRQMLSALMRYKGGRMVKHFIYSYFAGIRPEGELEKLAEREAELVNLRTGIIFIPAAISKTKSDRQVIISDNLKAWLKAYKGFPVIPVNFKNLHHAIRSHFDLKRDETRHSFISYHVAVHRSVGDAALQAGNSESMVRQHYLNLHSREEGEAFFSLVPDMKARRAVIDSMAAPKPQNLLKAV